MNPFRARIDGPVSDTWRAALTDLGGHFVEDDTWDLILPPMGKGLRAALKDLHPPARRSVAVVRGADALASKRALWSCLSHAYGRAIARRIVPETFLLDDPDDRRRVAVAHRSGDRWVLKHPHKQGRTGIKLLQHPTEARRWREAGYVVMQRFIADVLTRGDHRFHVRRYLVVVIDEGRICWYLADFGKCIYAREPVGGQADASSAFTSSRDGWTGPPGVPLTWAELGAQLADEGHDPSRIESKLHNALSHCIRAAMPLLRPAHLQHCRLFQIFGIDVVLDRRLHPWVLEANKRPEMRPRTPEDGLAKVELLRQTFRLGLGRPHEGFVRVGEAAIAAE